MYFIDFLTPTISGVYALKYINVSIVVNGTNVTENSKIETILFSGTVQVRLSHIFYAE